MTNTRGRRDTRVCGVLQCAAVKIDLTCLGPTGREGHMRNLRYAVARVIQRSQGRSIAAVYYWK